MNTPWIFAATQIESLYRQLEYELQQRPRSDPLHADLVLVGSSGMEQWLQAELATSMGICMNVRFEFLGRGLLEQLSLLTGRTQVQGWSVAQMAFGLLELLRRPNWRNTFCELPPTIFPPESLPLEYFDDLQLAWARNTADALDKLATYRPAWIRSLRAGELCPELAREPGGQALARMWLALESLLGEGHLLHLVQKSMEDKCRPADGPTVHLFGLSSLAPLYLEAAKLLSESGRARLYLFAPWRNRSSRPSDRPGCELGAALGRLGSSFIEDLGEQVHWLPPAEARAARSLLERLQLALAEDQAAEDAAAATHPAEDLSFQIHSCGSSLRQVEVLKDALLDWFSRHPELEARQVLIVTPNPEKYAPLVQTIFSLPALAESGAAGVLPLSLADGLRGGAGEVRVLLALLKLACERVSATAIFDFLTLEPIRRAFRLPMAQLDEVRRLLEESGLRWGIDRQERELHGLPADETNTVEFSLARLAAGATAGNEADLLQVGNRWLAPLSIGGSEQLELSGRLTCFLRVLGGVVANLRAEGAARSLPAWRGLLLSVLDELFAGAEEAGEERSLLVTELDELVDCGRRARFGGRLKLRALWQELAARLADASAGGRPWRPAITLGSLKAMRSLPYSIICLLGMDDGEFPRAVSTPGQEWLCSGSAWRDGDARAEELQMLLEVVMSARRGLVITFQGVDPHTGEERYPASPVAALLEFVRELNGVTTEGLAPVLRRHPLQPFSPRYFARRQPLRTYHGWASDLAHLLAKPRRQRQGLFDEADGGAREWPETVAAAEEITIDELLDFLRHPAKQLLRRTLGLYLPEGRRPLESREPVELSALEQWNLEKSVLECLASKGPPEAAGQELLLRLRAAGTLPLGEAGDRIFSEACRRMQEILTPEAKELLARSSPRPLRAEVAGIRHGERQHRVVLVGRARLTEAGEPQLVYLVHDRQDKPAHLLRAWLELLVASAEKNQPLRALIFGRERPLRLAFPTGQSEAEPALQAQQHLRLLLQLYFAGQHRPLPLPEKAAKAYALDGHRAREAYLGGEERRGDVDAYWEACFEARLPVDLEEFSSLARTVWEPLRQAMPERKSDPAGRRGGH